MHEGASPEEKLLKLIRKRNPSSGKKERGLEQGDVAHQSTSSRSRGEGQFDIFRRVDKLLILVIVLLLGYLVYQFVFGKSDVDKVIFEGALPEEEIVALEKKEVVEPKPFRYYEDKIKQRDIFESPVATKKPVGKVEPKKEEVPKFDKKLRVVGIVLDENSEAVIEDLDEKRTLFLHEGDKVGEATVEKIQEDMVILKFNDEIIELVP